MADWAADDFVLMCCQGNNRHKAKREEGPAGDAVCAPVAAIVALSCHAFVSFEVGGEV